MSGLLLSAAHQAVHSLPLQGHIWQKGFQSGELKGDLYPDTAPALAEWVSKGIKVYIYSSGSRSAQLNFFKYSNSGDLRHFLSGYFDTSSGPKVLWVLGSGLRCCMFSSASAPPGHKTCLFEGTCCM